MSSIRFVKGEKPQVVKSGDLEYQAGQLSFIGRKSIPAVVDSIRKYLKDSYGWTEETRGEASITVQGIAEVLLYTDSVILVLACDYTEKLTPADLLEWDEKFIEDCAKVIIELNPTFAPKTVNTGQAQPETHNEDGTAKSVEDTPKN